MKTEIVTPWFNYGAPLYGVNYIIVAKARLKPELLWGIAPISHNLVTEICIKYDINYADYIVVYALGDTNHKYETTLLFYTLCDAENKVEILLGDCRGGAENIKTWKEIRKTTRGEGEYSCDGCKKSRVEPCGQAVWHFFCDKDSPKGIEIVGGTQVAPQRPDWCDKYIY